MTEIADRVLRAGGPALLFENARHQDRPAGMPVLANLFGTPRRVAWGMGADQVEALRDTGELLASCANPRRRRACATPSRSRDAEGRPVGHEPETVRGPACQDVCK